MSVSVTKRSRAIGLRMAIGARPYDIQLRFLSEFVVQCLAGGIVGIALGYAVSIGAADRCIGPVRLSVIEVRAAVAISSVVSIVFGHYPAWKASNVAPQFEWLREFGRELNRR